MKEELLNIKESLEEALSYAQQGRPFIAIKGMDQALDILDKLIDEAKIDIESIVCAEFRISKSQLHSKLQNRPYVNARQVIMWYEMKYLKKTEKLASDRFKLDHSTAHHAKKTIEDLMFTDSKFNSKVKKIIETIASLK